MAASWTIALLLAILLDCHIRFASASDDVLCNALAPDTDTTDSVLTKGCTYLMGDFTLLVDKDTDKEKFDKWASGVKQINVNVTIESSKLDKIEFPKLTQFMPNSFIVKNNPELQKIIVPKQVTMFHLNSFILENNPKLEETNLNNVPMQLKEANSKFIVTGNTQLKTLKGINQELCKPGTEDSMNVNISNNAQLTDLEAGFWCGKLTINENPALEKITLSRWVDTASTTTTMSNIELKDLSISKNSNLKVIDFPANMGTFAIKNKLDVSNNYRLEAINLPKDAVKTELAEAALIGNHKLSIFNVSAIPSTVKLMAKYCPSLKADFTNITAAVTDKIGECLFSEPVDKLDLMNPCTIIDGDLKFADNANGTANSTITEVRGNVDLGNNDVDKLGFLKQAKISGQLSSTVCEFAYEEFENATNKAKAQPCNVVTSKSEDGPAAPNASSDSIMEIIIGGSIAAVILLSAIGVAIFIFMRRRKACQAADNETSKKSKKNKKSDMKNVDGDESVKSTDPKPTEKGTRKQTGSKMDSEKLGPPPPSKTTGTETTGRMQELRIQDEI